ncbi:NAD(P)/FAD-dependent oxidoreductase, partial [Staphylococcus aureus]
MIKSGVEVTMIHHSDKPLKGFNQTHVTQLIKKLEDEGVHFNFNDSRDFLSMDELPKRMTFIGVRYNKCGIASIMIKSGVEVTMIHHSDKPLKGFNQTHVTQL